MISSFYTDIKTSKIPNVITVSGIVGGLLYNGVINGFDGLKFSFIGLIIATVLLLILYLLGGIGAGDVKLFAAIGAITGTIFVLNTMMYSILYGGLIGVGILLYRKEFIRRMTHTLFHLFEILFMKDLTTIQDFKKESSMRFPFMYAVIPGVITAYMYHPM